jgi:transposase
MVRLAASCAAAALLRWRTPFTEKRFDCRAVTLVGDRGMIRSDQKAQAKAAGFHFITALTKPQIEKLLLQGVFQMELFEEQVCEVISETDQRYVLRRNPMRQPEMAESRAQKRQSVQKAIAGAQAYLAAYRRAKVKTQKKKIADKINRLGVSQWLKAKVHKGRLVLEEDTAALEEQAQLDGCYVIQTDLKKDQASAQTVHDRYKDLALVEEDFRTMKTGHLEMRPWFVRKKENTYAHALTCMLALKVRRRLKEAWEPYDLT